MKLGLGLWGTRSTGGGGGLQAQQANLRQPANNQAVAGNFFDTGIFGLEDTTGGFANA